MSDNKETERVKGRSREEIFSGSLKDKEVKQLCLFAVCCLLFAHNYTLFYAFCQS
ncbi:MAG: hypothetical protein IKI11_10755 [Neisseriaceae bacterium]|nr:hypothetical protein [Neisseriaceae bacterium]